MIGMIRLINEDNEKNEIRFEENSEWNFNFKFQFSGLCFKEGKECNSISLLRADCLEFFGNIYREICSRKDIDDREKKVISKDC